jgi:hypothetical protein
MDLTKYPDITYINISSQRTIKPFNHLNAAKSFSAIITTKVPKEHLHSTLSASTSTNQSNKSARLNLQVKVTQDTDIRSCRIPEVNMLKLNMTLNLGVIEDFAFRGISVNLWHRVHKYDNIGRCTLSRRHIRYEREYISGLDSTESGTLQQKSVTCY